MDPIYPVKIETFLPSSRKTLNIREGDRFGGLVDDGRREEKRGPHARTHTHIRSLTSLRSVETVLRFYLLNLGAETGLGQDIPVGVDLFHGITKGHFLLVVRRMKQPTWEITHPC